MPHRRPPAAAPTTHTHPPPQPRTCRALQQPRSHAREIPPSRTPISNPRPSPARPVCIPLVPAGTGSNRRRSPQPPWRMGACCRHRHGACGLMLRSSKRRGGDGGVKMAAVWQPLRYGSRRTRGRPGPVAAEARSRLGCVSVRGMWRGVVCPVTPCVCVRMLVYALIVVISFLAASRASVFVSKCMT